MLRAACGNAPHPVTPVLWHPIGMPVIPPTRSEPYVPPDQIVRDEEPGEPLEKASTSERTMLVFVAIMLFVMLVVGLVLPHTPWAGE